MKFPVPLALGVSNLLDRVLSWQFHLMVPLNEMRADSVSFGNHIFFGLLGKKKNQSRLGRHGHPPGKHGLRYGANGQGYSLSVNQRPVSKSARAWLPNGAGERWRKEKERRSAPWLSVQAGLPVHRRGWLHNTTFPTHLTGQLHIDNHIPQLQKR